jgi:hypothetical protein
MVDSVDRMDVDIAVEMVQIVVMVEVHNLVHEIPYQTEVVVPCPEHSLVEKALMEEELEVVVVVVVVAAVVVDRQPDQEMQLMVNVLEGVVDVENQDVLFVRVEIFVHDDV